MLEKHSPQKLDRIDVRLRTAAERHGGSVLAVSHVGKDALNFTLCFTDLYAALIRADSRFAAFLPSRIAACAKGQANSGCAE